MTQAKRPHSNHDTDQGSAPAPADGRWWGGVIVASLATLLLVLSGCGSDTDGDEAATADSIQLLAPDDFAGYLDANPDVALINVHIPYQGHIDGTDEFVPFDEILDWNALPTDRDAPIVLYCRSGNMSGRAASNLADAGYTNVVDLDGGMNAWVGSGRSLLDTPPAESG